MLGMGGIGMLSDTLFANAVSGDALLLSYIFYSISSLIVMIVLY
jgi:hypothetical protein